MASALSSQIQSTAGAIPVLNEKGEISMQKVKVHRYISGRRPKYAPEESSEGESEDELFPFDRRLGEGVNIATSGIGAAVPSLIGSAPSKVTGDGEEAMDDEAHEPSEAEKLDPRLRRLQRREYEDAEEKYERHRHIHEPEVISLGPAEDEEGEQGEAEMEEDEGGRPSRHRWNRDQEDSSDEDEELDDQAFEQRRALLRQRAQDKASQEEILVMEEEEGKSEESESSEYEEYTDSEEEEMGQRLKPVFVRKKDRITVQEREERIQKEKELEAESKRMAEERRRQTLKIVEHETRKEIMEQKKQVAPGAGIDPADNVVTDDENDEAAYEAWKLRELKRIKRDKDEKECYEKDRMEVERLHSLTEEERRAEQRLNPRTITNKAAKGKYKFLQKYYHRGAFYLDEEDTVLRRDFSSPTLEDHFNKTILPKVMQVKNFGRSGRTKYTHLVDQDTTVFDSPWMSETANNLKFHMNQAAGMKQNFDRPSLRKRKKTS